MTGPAGTTVVVHEEKESLAQAVAARLVGRLIDAQAARGEAAVVLTGGRVAAAVYRAVCQLPAREEVDWSRVDVWWGDERFLPAGDPDRNETQARAAMLDALPMDPARVHPMPAADGPDGPDPEAAANRYAAALAAAAGAGPDALPHFDVLLLGVGEDGHVASVFPDHPATSQPQQAADLLTEQRAPQEDVRPGRSVSAVRNSPKPPPTRLTLTLSAINTADEVWLIATGTDKAKAVGMALAGSGPVQLPAGEVRGVSRTLWSLDRDAATEVPAAGHDPH